jgi:hypothetical protein
MSALSVFVLGAGIALQVCLVGRLAWKGLWRQYPWFSSCVFWTLSRTLLFFVIPARQFSAVYWITDVIDVFVRFLLVWEAARYLLPKTSLASLFFSRGLHALLAATLTLAICVLWSYQAYERSHSVWAATERSVSLIQALMMLGTLLAFRYYDIPIGQQLRTIAVAFGVWASIATANNAVVDVDRAFLRYWQLIRPISYIGLLCMWNWGIWKQAPEPNRSGLTTPLPELSEWAEHWDRAQSAVRRAKSL